MKEVSVDANVVETMRQLIVRCIQDNKCECTQIWLNDDVVKQIKDVQIYGTINYPYEGYTMSAFELRTGEKMEITYNREKSVAIKNWHNTWSNWNVVKYVYFRDSEEYFFFGATEEEILVIK